jgi:hypothetical protein
MIIAQTRVENARLRHLAELARSLEVRREDRKRHSSYTRILLAAETFKVLVIIWKESEFVSEHEMSSCGLSKSFEPGRMTQLGLAKELASSGGDSSSFFNLVRNIGLAGEWFGLIERKEFARNKVILSATEKLHNIMTCIAQEYMIINSEFSGIYANIEER